MTQINPAATYYAHSPKGFEVNVSGSQIPSLLKKDFVIIGELTGDPKEPERVPFDEPMAKTTVMRKMFSRAWSEKKDTEDDDQQTLPVREEE